MIHKSLAKLPQFEAVDKTKFIEVLHPKNDPVDVGFSLGHASLEVGTQSLPHVLEKCSETYYFLKGEGEIYVDNESRKVKANDLVFIPAGVSQYVVNTGETRLECLVVVEPAWYREQDRLLKNS
jgi:mannose-6-phosphate isomerase-like protein (cupin superfamily)